MKNILFVLAFMSFVLSASYSQADDYDHFYLDLRKVSAKELKHIKKYQPWINDHYVKTRPLLQITRKAEGGYEVTNPGMGFTGPKKFNLGRTLINANKRRSANNRFMTRNVDSLPSATKRATASTTSTPSATSNSKPKYNYQPSYTEVRKALEKQGLKVANNKRRGYGDVLIEKNPETGKYSASRWVNGKKVTPFKDIYVDRDGKAYTTKSEVLGLDLVNDDINKNALNEAIGQPSEAEEPKKSEESTATDSATAAKNTTIEISRPIHDYQCEHAKQATNSKGAADRSGFKNGKGLLYNTRVGRQFTGWGKWKFNTTQTEYFLLNSDPDSDDKSVCREAFAQKYERQGRNKENRKGVRCVKITIDTKGKEVHWNEMIKNSKNKKAAECLAKIQSLTAHRFEGGFPHTSKIKEGLKEDNVEYNFVSRSKRVSSDASQ